MRSSLYHCRITHHRFSPREHSFGYGMFLFAIDLDELDEIPRRVRIFSRNRSNLCSFRDEDHLPGPAADLRSNLETWLRDHGVVEAIGSVLLVTSVRIAGYVFNPVSFYVCFDRAGDPLCAVSEISNTYGEMKPYLIEKSDFQDGIFRKRTTKHFYISPFLALDDDLVFRIGIPGSAMRMSVETWRGDQRILRATIDGERRPLTTASLAFCLLRYPLVTVHVIAAIHWQAFRLWLKGVPHYPKAERPQDQREIVKARPNAA